MLATSKAELTRGKLGFGEREFEARDEEVTKTMRAIKHALTERYYTWQDAVDVAISDPEIDMRAEDGQVYKPGAYEGHLDGQENWTDSGKERFAEPETVKTEKDLSTS